MRVLWIAQGCSLQDDEDNYGHVGRTEINFIRYCSDRVRLAVAYMADGIHESKFTQGSIVYYAVNADMRIGISEKDWETTRTELLRVIDDYRPDIIQCFGAEWPYGLIAEDVSIPIVIHMMGFLNIYYMSIHEIAPGYIPEGAYETDCNNARKNSDVTYFNKGENWFVQSGYNNNGEEIFLLQGVFNRKRIEDFPDYLPDSKKRIRRSDLSRF